MSLNPISTSNHRGLITLTIMMVAVLEVLDSTIVNIALPNMMPALNANQNQITWILTSYIVASAIVLPLTGFLSNRLGLKKFLLICIIGFMVSSFLCGIAQSLSEMIVFRIFQGLLGASLIPLSQAILRNTFPIEEQGKAMAIWGIGIMAAPILGPSLGGFITEYMGWRWIFYINLPICITGCLLALWVIPETEKQKPRIDWLGLTLMVISVSCFQIFLDKGNENNWFNSYLILGLFTASLFSMVCFLMQNRLHANPIIKFRLYKDRNFTLSSFMVAVFFGGISSMIMLEPIMLTRLFHYPTITTGMILGPMGLCSAFAMMMTTILSKHMNLKIIVSSALLISTGAAFSLFHSSLNSSMFHFIFSNALMGFGIGLFMIPMTTTSLITIPKPNITEAAGLYSYARMLGGSIGIALSITLVSRVTQIDWHHLASYITHFNPNFHSFFTTQHLPYMHELGIARLTIIMKQQSTMMGFIASFKVTSILFLLLIPLAFLFRINKRPSL